MKYMIILMILLLFSTSSYALSTCSKKGTRVIYTNGIDTTRTEADEALAKIKIIINEENARSILDKRIDKVITAFDLTYNYQESFVKDILESAVQRLPKSFIDSVKAKNAYEAYSYYLQGKNVQVIKTEVVNSIIESKLSIISSFANTFANLPLYEKTLNEMMASYNNAFKNGERIFAISHSQGSLFMHDMHNLLSGDYKRKFFSGYQVASVLDSRMDGHFDYATNSRDAVVNVVRFFIGALPDNLIMPTVVNTLGWSDLFINHGLLTTYLYDEDLKAQVIPRLFDTGDLLESNCNTAAIKITKQENLKLSFDSTDPEDQNVTDLTYLWNFGEGPVVKTNLKEISHTYAKAGPYDVTLKVVNNDGDIDTKKIKVNVHDAPKANISVVSQSNLQVSFDSIGNVELAGLKYSWNFGDGQTANTKNPSHTYSQLGTYTVTLKVTNAYGDFMTAEIPVTLKLLSNNVTFCHGSVDFRNNRYELFGPSSTLTVSIDESMSFSLYSDKLNCECQTVKLERGKNYRVSVTSTDLPLNKEEFMYEIIPNGRNRDTKVTPLDFNLYVLDNYSVSIATRLSFNLDPYGKPYLRAEDTRYSFCKSYSYK